MYIKKVQAVIYDIKDGKKYFLILHRILNWTGWELLKGTIKKREEIKEALAREIKEETGLKKFEIEKSLNTRMEFKANKRKHVIMDIFLVKADMNEKISLNQKIKEHDNYLWTDKETAIEKLTWDNAKKILRNLGI